MKSIRAGIGIAAAAVGVLASARERVERTYEELANRGETVIAHWRGRPEPRQTPQMIDLDGPPSKVTT